MWVADDGSSKVSFSSLVWNSYQPNCIAASEQYGSRPKPTDLRIAIHALRDIPAGTELTIDYNFTPAQNPDEVVQCKCRSANCRRVLWMTKMHLVLIQEWDLFNTFCCIFHFFTCMHAAIKTRSQTTFQACKKLMWWFWRRLEEHPFPFHVIKNSRCTKLIAIHLLFN